MKSSFLSPEQVFAERGLTLFEALGAAAPATDLALLTADDAGFLVDVSGGINYSLSDGGCVDRFGRSGDCRICAVRPAILLEPGDEALLQRPREDKGLTTVEYGLYPMTILDVTLRDMAAKSLEEGTLRPSGRRYTVAGKSLPVYQLGAKQIICLTAERS